jgi:hypothetical protein
MRLCLCADLHRHKSCPCDKSNPNSASGKGVPMGGMLLYNVLVWAAVHGVRMCVGVLAQLTYA